jgi:hypothetical protein
MAKRIGYADALKVLGSDDSTALDLAEKLVDGGLGAVGVPDLFGLRSQLVAKGRELLNGVRERISGVSRWDRTRRVEAAHEILILTAYTDAVEEAMAEPETRERCAEADLDPEEVHRVLLGGVHDAELSLPRADGRLELDEGAALMATGRPGDLEFVLRMRGVETQSQQQRQQLSEVWGTVRLRAHRRYRELYRLLSADVPEFGVWAAMAEHHATRAEVAQVRAGLADLHALLERTSTGRPVGRRRTELAAMHRSALDRPLLRSTDAPAGLRMPTLGDAYLTPRGALATVDADARPSADDWWHRHPVRDDLPTVLAALLTRAECTELPLVVLGHPGAGKSVLTEMLAAQLPPADYLPLRVELRAVAANAPIHAQLDEGLAATLHTSVSWRDLADDADGALPVIILDGFDELLQATGVDRSDYLEQVQRFQQEQRAMGRPVVVVVTSRTVVADRMRFPEGTTVIRLAPFDEGQVRRMVDVWARANSGPLASRGLRPPSPEAVLAHRELAEQPLLLLMLLLYDADANALHAGTDLSRSELYEELLAMFARREVRKHAAHLAAGDLERAVEEELRRLEAVAMAMFARRRQSVTAEELGRDLAVLLPDAALRPDDAGLHGAVPDAHQVLGRFFFVHESRARTGAGTASVFEFLHATFGEYLVARTVVAALADLAEDRRQAARRRFATPLDDGLLYALTSFSALGGSAATVQFTADLLERRFAAHPEDRADFRALLVELFREAPYPPAQRGFTDYAPLRLPVAARVGVHTANLVVLLVLVADEPVDLAELFPDAPLPWQELRSLVGSWRAMAGSQWGGTLDTIRVRHLDHWSDGGSPRSVLERERGEPVNVGECIGFELRVDQRGPVDVAEPYGITLPFASTTSRLLRSAALRVHGTSGRFVLMLLPYLRFAGTDLADWYLDPETAAPDGGVRTAAWAEAHDLLLLRLGPTVGHEHDRRRRLARLLSNRGLGRLELLALQQIAEEIDLSPEPGHRAALADTAVTFLARFTRVAEGGTPRERDAALVLGRLRSRLEAVADDAAAVAAPTRREVAAALDRADDVLRHARAPAAPDTAAGAAPTAHIAPLWWEDRGSRPPAAFPVRTRGHRVRAPYGYPGSGNGPLPFLPRLRQSKEGGSAG